MNNEVLFISSLPSSSSLSLLSTAADAITTTTTTNYIWCSIVVSLQCLHLIGFISVVKHFSRLTELNCCYDVCMRVGPQSDPCTMTSNDLLCFCCYDNSQLYLHMLIIKYKLFVMKQVATSAPFNAMPTSCWSLA